MRLDQTSTASPPIPANESDPLVTEDEAGRHLGGNRPISTGTLQSWRYTNRGPRWVRVGRQIRYRLSDLNAFLAAGVRDTKDTTDEPQKNESRRATAGKPRR